MSSSVRCQSRRTVRSNAKVRHWRVLLFPHAPAWSSSNLVTTSHGAPVAAVAWMGQNFEKPLTWAFTPAPCRTRSSTAPFVLHHPKGGAAVMVESLGSARNSSKVSNTLRSWLLNHTAKCKGVRPAVLKTSGILGARVWREALASARPRISS